MLKCICPETILAAIFDGKKGKMLLKAARQKLSKLIKMCDIKYSYTKSYIKESYL